jgi:hypothetical protein
VMNDDGTMFAIGGIIIVLVFALFIFGSLL